jgi:hypothetical protein
LGLLYLLVSCLQTLCISTATSHVDSTQKATLKSQRIKYKLVDFAQVVEVHICTVGEFIWATSPKFWKVLCILPLPVAINLQPRCNVQTTVKVLELLYNIFQNILKEFGPILIQKLGQSVTSRFCKHLKKNYVIALPRCLAPNPRF